MEPQKTTSSTLSAKKIYVVDTKCGGLFPTSLNSLFNFLGLKTDYDFSYIAHRIVI